MKTNQSHSGGAHGTHESAAILKTMRKCKRVPSVYSCAANDSNFLFCNHQDLSFFFAAVCEWKSLEINGCDVMSCTYSWSQNVNRSYIGSDTDSRSLQLPYYFWKSGRILSGSTVYGVCCWRAASPTFATENRTFICSFEHQVTRLNLVCCRFQYGFTALQPKK